MNDPIPVKDALRLIELALADCDKAKPGRWELDEANPECIAVKIEGVYDYVLSVDPGAFSMSESDNEKDEANASFIVLARATMRPLLALVKLELVNEYGADEAITHPQELLYPTLSALRDHYDATRPGWRSR